MPPRGNASRGRDASGKPSSISRTQARELGVSRNVVLQAYSQLEAKGYIGGARGSGTYVSSEIPDSITGPPTSGGARPKAPSSLRLSSFATRTPASLASERQRLRYGFAYGFARPDGTTLQKWQRALRKRAKSLRSSTGPPRASRGSGRRSRSTSSGTARSGPTAEQVVVTSGSQQALSLLSRILFEPGEAVVVEEPWYQGARQIFAADGLELLPWAVMEDDLEAQTRGAYVTPSHQFPNGATMPIGKRLKLLAWAEKRNAVVIEDDYDSEYRYEGRSVGGPKESAVPFDLQGFCR